MTDLYAFRALGSPRRTEPVDDGNLQTVWEEVDREQMAHVVTLKWGGGDLTRIIHQGWRAWRKPLIGHRIRLRDLNRADFGAHARQS